MTVSNPKRILIVDDTESIRITMETFLTTAGYLVATASDGEECFSVVKTFQPDLILLDIMMPGIHGFDVLKQLKSDPKTAHIGIIICSGKDYVPEKYLALQHCAFAYVTKPFYHDALLEKVGEYFSTSHEKIGVVTDLKDQQAYTVSLDNTRPYIRFWGTRGSIPVSGAAFIRHGGNTPCLEINDGYSTVIVDAGTGIRELGLKLSTEPSRPLHLFIGHTHWDHIQGFPFFIPAYRQDTTMTVYGASGFGKDLQSIFSGQLDADYFPVQLHDLPSTITFREMKENPIIFGTLNMFWSYVHHPGATVGFKFSLHGKIIVYITDNEFLRGYLGAPDVDKIPSEIMAQYNDLINFISNADILISEAQYTNEEYHNKIGWGHTSLSNGCLLCKLGNVKRWIVTHHDPMHTDEFLDNKLFLTRQILESIKYSIPVSHAVDGMTEYF